MIVSSKVEGETILAILAEAGIMYEVQDTTLVWIDPYQFYDRASLSEWITAQIPDSLAKVTNLCV